MFSNEKMLRTFSNLKITKQDGTKEFASSYITNITPYYYKLKPDDEILIYKLSKIKERRMNKLIWVK